MSLVGAIFINLKKSKGRKKVKKRKELEEYLKMMVKQFDPEAAEKIADLMGRIMDCLPSNPDEFISFEELGKALKPSKIVCATRKKFESSTEKSAEESPCKKKCGGCTSSSSCGSSDKCACAESDDLCGSCKEFLYQIIMKIILPFKDAETYPYEQTFYLGRYK